MFNNHPLTEVASRMPSWHRSHYQMPCSAQLKVVTDGTAFVFSFSINSVDTLSIRDTINALSQALSVHVIGFPENSEFLRICYPKLVMLVAHLYARAYLFPWSGTNQIQVAKPPSDLLGVYSGSVILFEQTILFPREIETFAFEAMQLDSSVWDALNAYQAWVAAPWGGLSTSEIKYSRDESMWTPYPGLVYVEVP